MEFQRNFKKAHKKFKETGELPPHLKKLVKDLDKVKVKHKVKNIVVHYLGGFMDKTGKTPATEIYKWQNNQIRYTMLNRKGNDHWAITHFKNV